MTSGQILKSGGEGPRRPGRPTMRPGGRSELAPQLVSRNLYLHYLHRHHHFTVGELAQLEGVCDQTVRNGLSAAVEFLAARSPRQAPSPEGVPS